MPIRKDTCAATVLKDIVAAGVGLLDRLIPAAGKSSGIY